MENNGLRAQIESKTAAVAAQAAPASTPATASPEELDQAKAEHVELLRLRGAHGMLMRKSAELAATAHKAEDSAQATLKANELDHDVVDLMQHIGVFSRWYSNENKGEMPTNFAQISKWVNDSPSKVSPGLLEFVQYDHPLTISVPGMILLREKNPRVFPDGQKKRAYLMVDGSVKNVSPDADGSFEAVEKTLGLATMGPITPVPPGQPSEASR